MDPKVVRRATITLIVMVTVGLCVWDIFAEGAGGDAATISVIVTAAAHRYLAIPVAWGFLSGHIFASQGYRP